MGPAIGLRKWRQFLTEVQLQVGSVADISALDLSSVSNSQELALVLSAISDIPQARLARELALMWSEFTAKLQRAA
jgi:hypothetical protein